MDAAVSQKGSTFTCRMPKIQPQVDWSKKSKPKKKIGQKILAIRAQEKINKFLPETLRNWCQLERIKLGYIDQ